MRDSFEVRRGMFYAAVAGIESAKQWCLANDIVLERAASETNNAAGGFTVPGEIGESLEARLDQYGFFRKFAYQSRMRSDSKSHPIRVGGATVYNPGENNQITAADLIFGAVQLQAKKMVALIQVSSDLEEDAVEFGAQAEEEFARAMAKREDELGFLGTGISTDFGITGIATLLADGAHAGGVDAASGHDTFAEIDLGDLTTLVSKLAPRALPGAAWYCSQVADALVFCRLASSAGGIQVVNNERTFLGRPIRTTPALPTTTGDLSDAAMLLFGDLRLAAALGTRREPTIARSALGSSLNTDSVLFRATQRVDIAPADIGDSIAAGAVVAMIGE